MRTGARNMYEGNEAFSNLMSGGKTEWALDRRMDGVYSKHEEAGSKQHLNFWWRKGTPNHGERARAR